MHRVILLGSLFLVGSININSQELSNYQKERRANLTREFAGYRVYAKIIVDRHLLRHKDCDIYKIIQLLDSGVFLFGELPFNVDATCFPDLYKTKVFFNTETNWNRKLAVRKIFHEYFHLIKYCGDDSGNTLRVIPVCRLFGESQYSSNQINEIVEKHFQKDFENESKSSTR